MYLRVLSRHPGLLTVVNRMPRNAGTHDNNKMTHKSRLLLPLALFCVALCSQHVQAATLKAASCSSSDVQAAINAASDGDTVLVPAGSCSWSPQVKLNKAITLQGGNGGTTTITSAAAVVLTPGTGAPTRLTGFTFTGFGTANDGDVRINTSSQTTAYRVDHNVFINSSNPTFIAQWGIGPGLIDHNSLTCAQGEMIHNAAQGPSDNSGWTTDVIPGGSQMTFIEDNTFTNTDSTYVSSALQSYYGARTVFRHNTLNWAQIDQHGTPGMIGARWWEIYENTINPQGHNDCCYAHIRAGSGVIWNNHLTGNWTGSPPAISLFEEDSGYPALYQIGRGINQALSPAYVWGNDSTIPVGSASSNVMQGRDFFVSTAEPSSMAREELASDSVSATYKYVPFTYPYPLDANGLPTTGGSASNPPSAPPPPSNLSAIVQ
jgi:hypothetical protein